MSTFGYGNASLLNIYSVPWSERGFKHKISRHIRGVYVFKANVGRIAHDFQLHHEYIRTLMDKERLNTLFKAIGAHVKYLRPENEVSPSLEALSAKRPTPPHSLKSVMRLLHRAATW